MFVNNGVLTNYENYTSPELFYSHIRESIDWKITEIENASQYLRRSKESNHQIFEDEQIILEFQDNESSYSSQSFSYLKSVQHVKLLK